MPPRKARSKKNLKTQKKSSKNAKSSPSNALKDFATKRKGSKGPPISSRDMLLIVNAVVEEHGPVSHHINQFNNLTGGGFNQIITDLFTAQASFKNKRTATEEDASIDSIEFTVTFSNVKVTRPEMTDPNSAERQIQTPGFASKTDRTYAAPILLDADIEAKAHMKDGSPPIVRTETVTNVKIAEIPVMVRSNLCHTSRIHSKNELIRLEEDPLSHGGHFEIGGKWIIKSMENLKFNQEHVHYTKGHGNELWRLDFLSRPGDRFENSAELIIKLLKTGAIVCQISIDKTFNKFKELQIPFYIIFRALGITKDLDVINYVADNSGYKDNKVRAQLVDMLKTAFRAKGSRFDNDMHIHLRDQILLSIYKNTSVYTRDSDDRSGIKETESSIQYMQNYILEFLARHLLPHLGNTPSVREKKAKYLGYLIWIILMTAVGKGKVIKAANRDSYARKRVYDAGISSGKVFKKNFNAAVVIPIKKSMKQDFMATSFSSVNLKSSFKSAVKSPDLKKSTIQTIISGSKTMTVRGQNLTHRLVSNALHIKNQLNVISSLRDIEPPNTSSHKQSGRADRIRRVDPSYPTYICTVQGPDSGDRVGMPRQMAIMASLAEGSNSEVLKQKLRNDKDLYPLHTRGEKLAKVFVNGDWIGYARDAYDFAHKYRMLRRKGQIHRKTTVYVRIELYEVRFEVDYGRIIVPKLIVERGEDPKHPNRQDIRLKQKHIYMLYRKEIGMKYLLDNEIMEYISPEEAENIHVAHDYETLWANRDNTLLDYTHCEIPQAIMGFSALTSPLADCNQAPRNTFQTNQVRQTCGWFALNWPYLHEKNTFLQYNNEIPLGKTIVNHHLLPNGMNTIVAIQIYGGYNQEDSLVFNQASIDVGMFRGSHFTHEKTIRDSDEVFGLPDRATTKEMPLHANYGKLDLNGVIRKGTIVRKGDVVIGKLKKINKPVDNYTHIDQSIIYKHNEPAYVENIIKEYNEDGMPFCKVTLRSVRPPDIGDKFSARAGQKGVIGMIYPKSDMPFTESGVIPDIIMNPHAIPSRMTINQLIEMFSGRLSAERGIVNDLTAFTDIDLYKINEVLSKMGDDRWGLDRMYNGMTGEWIDVMIFNGPCYYQRLQKFVIDEIHFATTSVTCAMTRQPVGGKSKGGTLRIGEMEKDVICSHGSARLLMEKFTQDSDAFKIYVCRNCGKMAVVNLEKNIAVCKSCGDSARIEMVRTKWSSKLFLQELNAMGIGTKIKLKAYQFPKV